LTNLLLPKKLSETTLLFFQPWRIREGKEGKFKAYYDWCYGPTRSNIKKITDLGYSVEEYIGFFGHRYYSKIKILHWLEMMKANLLVKYPLPFFTQYAQVLLKKRGPNLKP